jgi:antitoxin component of MazEF toxin-antitoxin module
MISRGEEIVLRKQPYDLAAMLDEVTPDNLHAEQDFGEPRGNEAW